jgi:hypothetical protein
MATRNSATILVPLALWILIINYEQLFQGDGEDLMSHHLGFRHRLLVCTILIKTMLASKVLNSLK